MQMHKLKDIDGSKCDSLEISPRYEEFEALAGYTHALVSAELSSDLETPVSSFIKLRGESSEPCFLLESAESGRMWGRYSFLGFEPASIARLEAGKLVVEGSGGDVRAVDGHPVEELFRMVSDARVHIPDAMRTQETLLPFEGGAVGYFGYRTLAHLEKVKLEKEPGTPGIPDIMFMFPRRLVAFDHLRSRMRLCVLAELGDAVSRREAFEDAVQSLKEMEARVRNSLPAGAGMSLPCPSGQPRDDFDGVGSNVVRTDFEEMVRRAQEHIFAGDAFQVVVSQRLTLEFDGDPLGIYRQLRAENPSPYMFYLQMPGVTLVGASPEPMVTRRGARAVIRPIAGTRPRGADEVEDIALELELKGDAKEKAEHIMLVDLARNDLGRVSTPGTVNVTKLMDVERYSHVMHMVSEVEGELAEGAGNHELFRASFPAGTVIGAPKVRASEIIEDLEPEGRGPYAGAVGYLSHSGDMDTCIAIRTVVVRDGHAHVQAGAGIVVDSDPSAEYEETLNKARAVVRAVRAASSTEECCE
ncbi:MAG TPA: anthranilate synthase component I family protein [Candidatus Anoxymicrobiaceae bacterium]